MRAASDAAKAWSEAWSEPPKGPPPKTLFEDAAFRFHRVAAFARHCANPECPAPYFIAKKKSYRYCATKCAASGEREAKRRCGRETRQEVVGEPSNSSTTHLTSTTVQRWCPRCIGSQIPMHGPLRAYPSSPVCSKLIRLRFACQRKRQERSQKDRPLFLCTGDRCLPTSNTTDRKRSQECGAGV